MTGYDAGKKVKGRKRHIITDTNGFLVFILVHAADIQDRDGAVDVLKAIRFRFPWLSHVFADGGYAGNKLTSTLHGHGAWKLESGDHKTLRYRKGLRTVATALGGRTHLRMARPMLPPRQRLGKVRRKLYRMGHHRQHPNAHPQNRKALNSLRNF